MQTRLVKALFLAMLTPCAWAQGFIENPVNLGTESGVGVISGFHCTSRDISFRINGSSIGKAGSGTERGDTQQLCGRTDTGFSLLFNFNLLAPGTHSLSMYASGQLVETRSFKTTKSAGEEYAKGKTKKILLDDFPITGQSSVLEWVTAKQSFVVTDTGLFAPANYACDMTASLHGVWTVGGKTFNLNKNNMSREANPKSILPCMILGRTSTFDMPYSGSYALERKSFMFLEVSGSIGTAFYLQPDPNNADKLTGNQVQFLVSDFSTFGTEKPATATRSRQNPTAMDINPSSPVLESAIRTTQALGGRTQ
jgi:hypothetical protein